VEDLADIVQLTEPHLSPDASRVAYVTTEYGDDGVKESTLWIESIGLSQVPIRGTKASGISNLRWSPDGSALTYLAPCEQSTCIWKLDLSKSSPERLEGINAQIDSYEWSPDGRALAIVTLRPSTERPTASSTPSMVFSDLPEYRFFVSPQRFPTSDPRYLAGLVLYDVRTKESVPLSAPPGAIIAIAWSPDSTHLALEHEASYSPDNINDHDISILDLPSNKLHPLVKWPSIDELGSWSADGKYLAYFSQGPEQRGPWSAHPDALYLVRGDGSANPRKIRTIRPTRHHKIVAYNSPVEFILENDSYSDSSLFRISAGGEQQRITGNTQHLSNCDINVPASKAFCVAQDLAEPPEVELVDLKSGALTALSSVNEKFRGLQAGQESEVRWTNAFGTLTNGYLILPRNYEQSRRFPLVIQMYGYSREFIGRPNWIPNYLPSAFSDRGMAVLLLNPGSLNRERIAWGDFRDFRRQELLDPLASIHAAVELLVKAGIADPKRIGIMGWSMGGFWTLTALSRSNVFAAASVGEPGSRDPMSYWLAGVSFRRFLDSVFGGPPVGPTLKNWEAYSPSFQRPPRHTPVLFEYGTEDIFLLEPFESWKSQGAEAQVALYPGEPHEFNGRQHIIESATRNLDWFSYWLTDYRDPSPDKREQYESWDRLKALKHPVSGEKPVQ
jgi:dipeptidyl aminopeptidase/acylaminoacyl peptidase